jgi:tetratricopeptide (TPR) repeat protein
VNATASPGQPALNGVASAPIEIAGRTEDEAAAEFPETPPAEAAVAQRHVRWAMAPEVRGATRRLERAHAVLRADPDHPAALRDQIAALAALGRWSEAADTAARLVFVLPDDNGHRFEHAALLIQAQRWSDAVSVLTDLSRRTPDDERIWFNLAVAHQAAGHLADARRTWDRTIELADTPAARARRGEVLLDLAEWSAAAADFAAVLAATPAAADAALNLALAHWRGGDVPAARRVLLDWLARHPRDVPALNRLGEIAWAEYSAAPRKNAARRVEALDCWDRSLALNPDQPDVRAKRDQAR